MAKMPKNAAPTKTYQTKLPIRHDGADFAAGDLIDLADDQADALLALGAVGEAPAAAVDGTTGE